MAENDTAEVQPFSIDLAYRQIEEHLTAANRLRAAVTEHIDEQNRRMSQATSVITDTGVIALTAAEARVARLLVTPMSIPELADRLHLSTNTVKTHMKNIYRKLGVDHRHAAAEAIRGGGATT